MTSIYLPELISPMLPTLAGEKKYINKIDVVLCGTTTILLVYEYKVLDIHVYVRMYSCIYVYVCICWCVYSIWN